MKVNFANITNRKLNIGSEKLYDVSLIEKNDIIKIAPGRVLTDMIIIDGSVNATQSASTGCDEAFDLGKGERL